MKETKNIKIIRNYSSAIYDLARQQDMVKEVLRGLTVLKDLLEVDKNLYNVLVSPIVHKMSKISLISKIFSIVNLDQNSKNFFILLVNNGRVNYFFEILDYFKKLISKSDNIKMLTVISAKKLEDNEKAEVKTLLSEEGSRIEIEYVEDKTIMGGIIIKYDSTQIDYSLKGCLDAMKVSI